MAKTAGLSDGTIEAMRIGKAMSDLALDETAALILACEFTTGIGPAAVSDAVYTIVADLLGERGVFEVLTLAGFYIGLSHIVNTFQMPCANGEPSPFAGTPPNAPMLAMRSGALPSRVRPLLPASLSSSQRALYDRIVSSAKGSTGKPLKTRVDPETGSLLGPFNAMLLNPVLGSDDMDILEHLRFGELSIPQRVMETVVLYIGEHFKAGHVFCSHVEIGKAVGVSESTIESLRRGQEPPDLLPDQIAALALARELNSGVGAAAVSDATYEAAVKQLTERGVVEVVTILGFYTSLSHIVNTFRMPCAGGEPDPFIGDIVAVAQ